MNRPGRQQEIGKGVVAGFIGGLAGSWTMSQFQALLSKLSESTNGSQQKEQQSQEPARRGQAGQQEGGDADATVKLANKIAQTVLHRELKPQEKEIAGPVVHYGFGATVGALYGGIAESLPAAHRGAGLPFGTAV